jgi:hypothetical protein
MIRIGSGLTSGSHRTLLTPFTVLQSGRAHTSDNSCPETPDRLLITPISAWFALDHPSRMRVIGDTSCLASQSHVIPDSKDLAGLAVKMGASRWR